MALIHLLTSSAAGAGGRGGSDGPPAKRQRAAVGGRAAGSSPHPVRVLVAAHTNVAVDRVLLGLAGPCGSAGARERACE